MSADHARKIDPTLAARYYRLIVEEGKHHNSAVTTIAAVLLTRIAACLRNGTRYELRDTDGSVITEQEGRAICAARYTIPPKIRAARRQLTTSTRQARRNERAEKGVAKRSEAPPEEATRVRVFVSSVMRGYEEHRHAVIDAVQTLGYEADHAGNYGGSTDTPQRALTAAVRAADLTVLLLGERYGEQQPSGLSATHEEFREARDHRHVIAFVQAGVEPEDRQREFIREVQEWAGGKLTEEYETPPTSGGW
jgi:hypothetical protein